MYAIRPIQMKNKIVFFVHIAYKFVESPSSRFPPHCSFAIQKNYPSQIFNIFEIEFVGLPKSHKLKLLFRHSK